MTIYNNKIHPTDSVLLAKQLDDIEQQLDANYLDRVTTVALIPILKNTLIEIETKILKLKEKLTDDSLFTKDSIDIESIEKTKATCDRVYHKCLTAKLFSSRGRFDSCPHDILLEILSFLSVEDHALFSKCSKFFYALCESETAWKNIFYREFPSLSIPHNKSAKEMYLSRKAMINGLKNGFYTCSTLIKQETPLNCLKKDGNLIFWASSDSTIKVWDSTDLTNLSCITSIKGHTHAIYYIQKDDELLFSGSLDRTIKVWDLTNLQRIQCIATLKEHAEAIHYLHKEGNLLFSGSEDKTIKVWDLTDLQKIQCIATLKGHKNFVVCLLKQGHLLFSGSWDSSIKAWDLTDLNNISCISTLTGHQKAIFCLLQEGTLLFSGSNDDTIKIWDLTDLHRIHCIATLIGHQGAVHCIHQEDNFLFSGSLDNTIKVWDLADLKNISCIGTLKGHQNNVFYIKKEGNLLFSGSWDNTIKVWNLTASLQDTLLNFLDMISSISNEIPSNLWVAKKRERLRILSERMKNLPPLIQNKIDAEFNEIHTFEKEKLGSTKYSIKEELATCEKNAEAIQRYLLKEVIKLFNEGYAKKAMDLFNKLPEKIKNKVHEERSHKFANDNSTLIEAIEKFLKIKT